MTAPVELEGDEGPGSDIMTVYKSLWPVVTIRKWANHTTLLGAPTGNTISAPHLSYIGHQQFHVPPHFLPVRGLKVSRKVSDTHP